MIPIVVITVAVADRRELAAFDHAHDARERIVHILDELDADDVNSARFYLQGLLDDLDAASPNRGESA